MEPKGKRPDRFQELRARNRGSAQHIDGASGIAETLTTKAGETA